MSKRDHQSGWQPFAKEIKSHIRRRLTFVIMTVIVTIFSVAAMLVILKVLQARDTEIEELVAASNSLSQALDREVERAHALLAGLESSPALDTSDLKQFHKQLTETTVPKGAWLVLSNKEKVLLHSLYPFGTHLPSLSEFEPQPEFLDRIDKLAFSLTGRVRAVMRNTTMVTVNLKVSDPDGTWRYFLTTVLSDQRFASIIQKQHNPSNLMSAIYDHNNNGIVSVKAEKTIVAPQMAKSVAAAISAKPISTALSKLIYADDPQGSPSLIAVNRSELTQWTVTTSMLRTDLDAPLFDTLRFLSMAALALLVAGGIALLYLRRTIEIPIDVLQTSATQASDSVDKLTQKLLHIQEDEHQRIAQELHVSTTQHLVGALLGVMSIENRVNSDKNLDSVISDVKTSIELALNELRTFSYLLHPRDIGKQGLAAALIGYVHGFMERSGLHGEVLIDPAVDDLPFELQHSLLRIGQEALANVHRHAKATYISVTFEIDPDCMTLTIEDNGQSSGTLNFEAAGDRNGVGIPSMRSRLIPFGAELKIQNGPTGTTVRAIIPNK